MYKRTYGLMPRTIGGLMEDVMNNGWTRFNDEVAALSVPVNIKETDKSYELHMIAPGLSKEDFKINVDQNTLNVAYEHKTENKEQQDGKWIRSEYRMKSFKRSFTLTEKIDSNGISARYADGVLVMTMPKKENSEPATHAISVN